MSRLQTQRELKISENIDRIFGNSLQARELKSIALKSALGQLTEQDMVQYWADKERDLAEIKERLPVANDLCHPIESFTVTNQPLLSNVVLEDSTSQYNVNGPTDVSEQREAGGNENPAIKHEVVQWHSS
jgi:hypothetical protein